MGLLIVPLKIMILNVQFIFPKFMFSIIQIKVCVFYRITVCNTLHDRVGGALCPVVLVVFCNAVPRFNWNKCSNPILYFLLTRGSLLK